MQFFRDYLPELTLFALLDMVLIAAVLPVVLAKKRNSTVAVAWCLVVLFMPLLGATLFWAFGFNYINRRLKRKRSHRSLFRAEHPPARHEASRGATLAEDDRAPHPLANLALAVNAFPVSEQNAVTLYHDTLEAFAAIRQAIAAARHHVHLEFFIVRSDDTARGLIELLAEKARAGVEVRMLVDSVGTLLLTNRLFRPLLVAGGQVWSFLPVNPLRSRIQINLRNHRKIVVVDGAVAFTGGMNIGDEYLHKSKRFGYWRDTMIRLDGPAVAALQRVFIEDWDYASGETLNEEPYFPPLRPRGEHVVQVVESGPDQEPNSNREVYFAAILAARRRLWIASPYFVPDSGLLDALRLARLRGVDVRLLCLWRPDHFLSFYASRYYYADLLNDGGHVYQYTRGMMHAKVVVVDDDWAMVGTSNLDYRSLHLNFEVNCVLYSPPLIAELEAQFLRDFQDSRRLDPEVFAQRSLIGKLTENACRLFSPIL